MLYSYYLYKWFNWLWFTKIDESKKDLITKQSAIDLNNLFNENVSLRHNEQKLLTREEITKKVVLNNDNFIHQKINENNLIKKIWRRNNWCNLSIIFRWNSNKQNK